ncbi:MAG: GtrA family protein [Bacteroidales bacterium]|nr:GtrA family protein [Bacteroidales bacterium]MCM1416469.1 GtrA family protein [bacterium]MCM1424525.1 GtrA family protein [bacterium]
MIKKLWDFGWGLYRKHEEGFNYLIFGFLAFVLNYILYFVFADALAMHYMAATVLSWVLTVVFAYWTNRTFVFKSQNKDLRSVGKEFVSFIGARVATEVLEIVLMYVMVDVAAINDKISKLVCQTIVILANYVLSKIWIFKGGEKEDTDGNKKEEAGKF